jgi:hypothetical protein
LITKNLLQERLTTLTAERGRLDSQIAECRHWLGQFDSGGASTAVRGRSRRAAAKSASAAGRRSTVTATQASGTTASAAPVKRKRRTQAEMAALRAAQAGAAVSA